MGNRKKNRSGGSKQRAIPINLAKLAFVGYTLSIAGEGMGSVLREQYRDWHTIFRTPLENLLTNWKTILPVGLGIAFISKALGRWMPRFGIPKLVSIKPI